MRRIYRNKRGFTLVEMMLALAIIVIIGWTTVALMMATKDSFMTTYNTNDSADYAVLYSNGFENFFLKHTQEQESGKFFIRTSDSVLMQSDSAPAFVPRQMKTGEGASQRNKWTVRMYFKVDPSDASQTVHYKIFVLDNYYNPNRVMSVYESSVWPPHLAQNKLTTSNYPSGDTVDTRLRADYSLGSEWKNIISYTK